MSGRKSTLIVTTGILIGLLVAGPTAHAAEAQPIRVSSYKGATLEVGDRSGLVIGPSGAAYTVTSSNPDTVAVEQVQTFWVAIARTEGSAEITVSNQAGGNRQPDVDRWICRTTGVQCRRGPQSERGI